MLRYRQDLRSLAFVGLTIALLIAPHWHPVRDNLIGHLAIGMVWVAVSSLFCFIASMEIKNKCRHLLSIRIKIYHLPVIQMCGIDGCASPIGVHR